MRSRIESLKKNIFLRLFILLFLFCFFGFNSYSQTPANPNLDSLILTTEKYIVSKDFESSHSTIRVIFNNYDPIPINVIYLYGRTMLGKKQYVPARDAFKKYLSVEDAQKLYSKEAIVALDSSIKHICSLCENTGFKEVDAHCAKCHGEGRIKSNIQCSTCNGVGTTLCQICHGRGVFSIKKGMSDVFQQCSSCEGKGYAICPKCKGSKYDSYPCDFCKGNGKVKSREVCPH